MMIDWGALLARKYDLMQQGVDVQRQNADTQRIGVNAAAGLDNTRAGLMPAESASNIALQAAQRGLTQANMRNVDETTRFVAPLARANIGYLGAQSREAGARAGLISEQTEGEGQLNKLFGGGMGFRFSDPLLPRRRPLDSL